MLARLLSHRLSCCSRNKATVHAAPLKLLLRSADTCKVATAAVPQQEQQMLQYSATKLQF